MSTPNNADGNDEMSKENSREAASLPWKKMVILLLAQFTNSFSIRVIFPILPFMIHDFFPELASSQLGFYAGFLGCIFSAGGFFGGLLWGRMADVFGRRPALLLGTLGTLISVLTFGFSINFAMAMTSRFLWGLLNGNIGVVKAYIAEICTEETQARGFSLVGLSGGIGRLMGPIISGLLSCPAVTYDVFNVPIFRQYPYLLPCLSCVFAALVCLIGTFCFLPETGQYREMKEINNSHKACINHSDEKQYEEVEESTPLLHDCESNPKIEKSCGCCSQLSFISRILKDKTIMLTIILYGLLALIGIIQAEVLPLLLVTDSKHGGFNFDASEISFLYVLLAIPEILNQIFIYPRLAKKYSYTNLFRTGLILSGFSVILYPFLSTIVGPIPAEQPRTNTTTTLDPDTAGYFSYDSEQNLVLNTNFSIDSQTTSTLENVTGAPWSKVERNLVIHQCNLFSNETSDQDTSLLRIPVKAWAIIGSIVSFTIVLRVVSFTCIMTLVNNSCLSRDRATVNGLGQSFSAFFRALGPAAFSNFFAWTENNYRSWPLNYHLTFYIVSILSFTTAFLSCFLPKHINKRKIESHLSG